MLTGAVSPSDLPRRTAGVHTRSGNAMARTRAAVLRATAECVERYGVRRTTMTDVASRSGVAKATLYNHFRTKDDLLAALVEAHVEALAADCAALAARPPEPGTAAPGAAGAAAALAHAAVSLSSLRALRRVAAEEPALLVALTVPGETRAWEAARTGVRAVLEAAGRPTDPPSVDLVLRWLTAHLAWPATPEQAAAQAALLDAALRAGSAVTGSGSGHD